jgi:hypothetical protein
MIKFPEKFRLTQGPMGSPAGALGGMFLIGLAANEYLQCLASCGHDWEHVSVVRVTNGQRTGRLEMVPSWANMQMVKTMFWDDEDVVMQLHPRKSEYVNNHPAVLHLWRPLKAEIPTPPPILVGIPDSAIKAG